MKVILNDEGAFKTKGQLCVPREGNLISTILEEDHNSKYSIIQVPRRCIDTWDNIIGGEG